MPATWPASITIIRHGQSERNVLKEQANARGEKWTGVDGPRDQDTPLTSIGRMQARCVGQELRKRISLYGYPAVFFVSPYSRTKQTSEEIVDAIGGYPAPPKIVTEERIREVEFGILDGLSYEGVKAKYPEEVNRRAKEGKYWYRPPGGENRPDVCERVRSFLGTLVRDYEGQHVVVICHSVVVLCFRRLLERWGEEEYMKVDKEDDVKNCSITVYAPNENGSIRLKEYNTICYPE